LDLNLLCSELAVSCLGCDGELVLRSSVTWQSIAHSQTDLDYLRGRQANRDEILNIFGVPVGLVSDNATEANAKVAERTFIERTLYPKLVRVQAVITAELLPFWERGAVAQFDDIRPTDRRMQIDEMQAALPVMSVNEVRARYYSLPPVPWGDVSTEAIKSAPLPETEKPAAAVLDELRAWEKFTLRRLGREDVRPFAVEHVPDDDAIEISVRLVAADDADAVKTVFREARERLTPV
ncbi:MAG: phage portal protein, partial [Chloroflexota bacterium]